MEEIGKFKNSKVELLASAKEKWSTISNPYDEGSGERNYWTCNDAFEIMEQSYDEAIFRIAYRIFKRHVHLIAFYS